jgi:hypothetical protein
VKSNQATWGQSPLIAAAGEIVRATMKEFYNSIVQAFPKLTFQIDCHSIPGTVIMTPSPDCMNEHRCIYPVMDIIDHVQRHLPMAVGFELQCIHATYGLDGKVKPIHPIGTHRRKPKEKKPNNRTKTNAPWKINS